MSTELTNARWTRAAAWLGLAGVGLGAFGALLAACRELQYETGLTDPDAILDRVLANAPGGGPAEPSR